METIGVCSCRVVSFNITARSGIMGAERGLAKIVIDPRSGVIAGIHFLAPHASEFIVAATLMIKHRYTVEDLVEAIHAFPTEYEVVKLAGQAFIRYCLLVRIFALFLDIWIAFKYLLKLDV